MTPEEKRVQAEQEERQRLINEADRPRIRALELEARNHPGYFARQPGLPLGKWNAEGPPGIPDNGKPCLGCQDEAKTDNPCWIHGANEIR